MKLGRNDLCHCGSGQKYKKCHLAADEAAKSAAIAATNAAAVEAARLAAEEDPEGTAAAAKAAKGDLSKKAGGRSTKPAVQAPEARKSRRRGIA